MRLEILRRHLLRGVSRLGLAVSGGADSVALFHLLLPVCRDAGIAATVLHLNHGLRAEAEEDLRFVKELADSEGAPFFSESANLASLTRDGESLEMAARAARMDFFKRCRDATGLDAIATGHHADDVAETVLLRLARGAGAAGLSGLRPVSRLSSSLVLIRPLLSVSDSALRGWLTGNHQVWREDKTNRDEGIPRNFVRNTLLPHLEQTWVPDLRERLCQSAEALREDDALLEALAQRAREAISSGCTLSLAPLRGQPEALQRRILRQWLFSTEHGRIRRSRHRSHTSRALSKRKRLALSAPRRPFRRLPRRRAMPRIPGNPGSVRSRRFHTRNPDVGSLENRDRSEPRRQRSRRRHWPLSPPNARSAQRR